MIDDDAAQRVNRHARWFNKLAQRDPKLHAQLMAKGRRLVRERHASSTLAVEGGIALESTGGDDVFDDLVLETLVREGRPALMVQHDAIQFSGTQVDVEARSILDELQAAAPTIEPWLPQIGRIDVANYAGNLPFLGTGWLVAPGIVVTNRHVAELMAKAGGEGFVFKPGRFGERLVATVDYRREHAVPESAVAAIRRVLWIEPDEKKADIAFLEVGAANGQTEGRHLILADQDAQDGDAVVVIGYPARAPAYIIPDQSWMDRVFGGTYDIKRIAPGLMGPKSRGWATHDCSTLGGNSGAVVMNMGSGHAVALHFAGLYRVENYAVPASEIRRYLHRAPWREVRPSGSACPQPTSPAPRSASEAPSPSPGGSPPAGSGVRKLSLTIPLQIDVCVGPVDFLEARGAIGAPGAPSSSDADQAARSLERMLGEVPGVHAVRAGALVAHGRLASTGLIVSAHPARILPIEAVAPRSFQGFEVVVEPASVLDQRGRAPGTMAVEAAASSIAYNDADRRGEAFRFKWLNEDMTVTLHVGPERSWTQLAAFLAGTRERLVSSIYEFHAAHIAGAVGGKLDEGIDLKLVAARQTRNPASGKIAAGDFDRSKTFADWELRHPDNFENIYVPTGGRGLVANSYHIKVSVRDEQDVWLSSGNWKRASQPLIADADLNDPRATSRAGNREWHVSLSNRKLADLFRNHILEDLRVCRDELGGTLEAVEDPVMVDVPAVLEEAMVLEAAAQRVFEPLEIGLRRVRVKPLLTPDRQGKVFTEAVLALIESAEEQLVFQNQYISFAGVTSGNLKVLVDAITRKSRVLDDCRIILRSGGDGFLDDMRALQLNGLDVERCVRRLANTHTKGIVVDGHRVLIGSHNWSSDGVTLNRDASLIFDDREVAAYFLEVFEADWQRANALKFEVLQPEAAPRLAEGDEPPPGFVRMSLAEYLER
ncbi:phospholipase D-like domain-containing protein [Kinneretia aquatilis]|nr:phospholipase D-like domain-containing protein [Paucibacter aquatile]